MNSTFQGSTRKKKKKKREKRKMDCQQSESELPGLDVGPKIRTNTYMCSKTKSFELGLYVLHILHVENEITFA